MNKPVFILFTILVSFCGKAQNLVPNPDFEYFSTCPTDAGQTNVAFPWYDPSGTSDYFNECYVNSGGQVVDVPSNFFGYQPAHSGKGYCGFGGTNAALGGGEYIAIKLTQPLIAGASYQVSFWLSRAENGCMANNSIGAYFDNDSISFVTTNTAALIPRVQQQQVIIDTANWVYFESCFIAVGGERFLSIGTFDTSNIQAQFINCVSSTESYYYIDDVSVTRMNDNCTIAPILNIDEIPNVFTPDGDGLNDHWTFTVSDEIAVTIINRWGNIVYQAAGKQISWDGGDCTDGVYFFELTYKQQMKTGFIRLIR